MPRHAVKQAEASGELREHLRKLALPAVARWWRAEQSPGERRISVDQAVPGDLVVMPGHIGFYAGNGQILHAPYTGTVVRVQPIWTSDYYIVRI